MFLSFVSDSITHRCCDGFLKLIGMVLLVNVDWCFLFWQYGLCVKCPTKESGVSVLASIFFPMVLCVLFGILFMLRSMAPRGMMKVGISMLQIVASANSVYSIPWPQDFSNFLDVMKLFMVCIHAC